MSTDLVASSVGLDTSSLALLAAAGTDADRDLLEDYRDALRLLGHPDLDEAHQEAARRLSQRLEEKIHTRCEELGAETPRRRRIRRSVEQSSAKLRGMTKEERSRHQRDLIYRVARHRGARENDARRIALEFTARSTGLAAQVTRERRPSSTHSRGSRRRSTSSRASGSRGDPDPGDSDPPAKKRRPCLNCAAFTERSVDWRGHAADLCPTCIDRLADGQRPVLAALNRAFGKEIAV